MRKLRQRLWLVALVVAVGVAPVVASAAPQPPPITPIPVTVVNTDPIAVTPAGVTHLGQPVGEHVRLITGSSGDDPNCGDRTWGKRVFPDGTDSEGGAWVVPEGKVFVLTDVEFGMRERDNNLWAVGDLVTLEVQRSAGGSFDAVWHKTVAVDDTLAAGGELWDTATISAGVVFPGGQALCLQAGKGFEGDSDNVSVINLTQLWGYLIDG